jgi:hypothetical protein
MEGGDRDTRWPVLDRLNDRLLTTTRVAQGAGIAQSQPDRRLSNVATCAQNFPRHNRAQRKSNLQT